MIRRSILRKTKWRKEFLEGRRTALLAKKEDLLRSRHRADLREEIPSRTPQNAADFAVGNALQEVAVSLSEGDARMRGLVEEALARLNAQEYGLCQDCGEPIPKKRLEAVPWAQFCIPCQETFEEPGHVADESDVVYAT